MSKSDAPLGCTFMLTGNT